MTARMTRKKLQEILQAANPFLHIEVIKKHVEKGRYKSNTDFYMIKVDDLYFYTHRSYQLHRLVDGLAYNEIGGKVNLFTEQLENVDKYINVPMEFLYRKYSMYSLHDDKLIMKADTLEELSEYAHNCSIGCEWYIVNNFTGERVATHRYE